MTRLSLLLISVCGLTVPAAGTAAEPAPPLRLALVSDTHTTRGTKDDQPMYRGRFDRVIAAVNAAGVDVVVVAGDLTQNGKPEEFDDFKAQVRGFHAPVYWVPGNHDIGPKRIPDKQAGPAPARLARYVQTMGRDFYVQPVRGVRLLAIDSQLFGSGLPEEEKMWTLLEQQLAAPGGTPALVFMHMPPFVKSADEPGGDYWNIEPAPRARLLALLKRGGVAAVLTGHLHYQLVNHYAGIPLVTTPPVSFGLPLGIAPQGWTLVTIPPGGEPTFEFKSERD